MEYITIKQLGERGKEGTTFLVINKKKVSSAKEIFADLQEKSKLLERA